MFSLLGELVEQYVPGKSDAKARIRMKLKGRSFETIYHNNGESSDKEDGSSSINPYDSISIAAYELRESWFIDQGNDLEKLCDTLPQSAHPVLSFLFTLRSIPSPKKDSIPPLSNHRSYPSFPKELFTKDLNEKFNKSGTCPVSQYSFFNLKPVTNLTLVPIPPLAATLNGSGQRRIRVPRKEPAFDFSSRDCEEDAGYDSCNDEKSLPFPWSDIMKMKAPSSGLRRNWEFPSVIDPPKELPYITEYSEGVLKAWALGWHNLKLSNPDLIQIPSLIVLKEKELIIDIGYLMIGIASRSFGFKSSSQEFFVSPGLSLKNLTPETFSSYTQEYITCGTHFRRLERFVEKRNLLEGLIFQCFQSGIQNYLDGFRAMVLKIVSVKDSLLELSKALRPLCKHVFFLAELCKVTKLPKLKNNDDLPRGIRLLSYLFDMTYYVNTKDLYFVLISILRITSRPYFRFLERWVFEGVCYDEFSEFGLIEHGAAASYRDRRYWDYAYIVENIPNEDSGTISGARFIADIQNQIYKCGKALNFLKLCCSNHFLCCTTPESQPRIKLLVSLVEEQKLKKEVKDYTEMMNSIAEEKSLSIKMHKLNLENEKKSLAKIARYKHLENLKRIEKNMIAEKFKKDEKKRLIFEDLKEQARQGIKKREEKRSLEAKEDKEWMEMALKKESETILREELVRKEIENHYRSLTDAAERREKVAQWKLKRHALRQLRIKFWRIENQTIKNHLQNQINDTESLNNLTSLSSLEVKNQNNVTDTWKLLTVKTDDLNNILLNLEDEESNVISINVSNWSSFTSEEQTLIISAGNVNNLPGWIKERLLENYSSQNLDNQTQSKPSTCPSNTLTNRMTNKNKMIVSSITFEDFSDKLELQDKKKVMVVKKNDISVIDGRKRPPSRHIEDVLYSKNQDGPKHDFLRPPSTDFNFNFKSNVNEYTKNYSELFSLPIGNDFSDQLFSSKKEIIDSTNPKMTNVQDSSNTFIPLSILMENSILIPLRTQKSLVNQALLHYMLVDSGLLNHFEACRNFLLFYDGEFGHKLSFSIFDEISNCRKSQDICNPATLNRLVDNAISSCRSSDSKSIHNVGFKKISMNLNKPIDDILNHLVLTYRTEWPYNVILTNEALEKYGELFKFLVQLKKTVWALQQVHQHLKFIGKTYADSQNIHALHLMRNEMLNFITVAQGYISTQVLDLCWQEFQEDLENKVKSLDELYEAHEKYLNKALFRCLLNKKAKPVQKIINDIFNIIVKFSLTLTNTSKKSPNGDESPKESLPFPQLDEYFNVFKDYSSFLYQVVSKLSARGYQHHLHDLMLRLNFSGFYQKLD
ncbi:gamma-tubulin complex component 6 [Lepeophtheirus salmonis]|uniref:gamma-tubulin complex component 6 n=1 Tax=Lepeophtheirus salmonis TaxID=72036 RepID=UPI001AE48F2A|nr:gamma-tubulin complex component 6-like isoform X1 [Lepeophtheirus salmonis]